MRFCAAWDRLDFDAIAALLATDIVYHNVPLETLHGKDQVEAYLRGAGPFDDCKWEIRSIAVSDTKVLTERVDRMLVKGKWIELPVMGTFEVAGGLIQHWRDYFDLAGYRAQWQQAEQD